MRLSLILPCYNEEPNVGETVRACQQWMEKEGIDGEIIAVNDGSKDGTQEVLETLQKEILNLVIVRHAVNLGYGSAVRSGCDKASQEYVAYMDSDGQFNPEDFGQLLPLLNEYDFVTGRRLKRADPFIRRINAKLFALLNFFVLGIWVRDINCAMKVWKRSLWPTIRPTFSTGALINAEMFYRMQQNGIRWKQVMVHHYPRLRGTQTGANLKVILRMFTDLFKLKKAGMNTGKSL
ncbi:MAG: glycosyltransferase family 2 protein [Candidatus Peregrinibacteria bacterium]